MKLTYGDFLNETLELLSIPEFKNELKSDILQKYFKLNTQSQ